MFKIGYNISDKHCGSSSHLETPERLNYCISQIKKKFQNDIFIQNITYSQNELFEMILNVHSQEYINNLIKYVPSDYTCRKCSNRIKSNNKQFAEFINETLICKMCNKQNNSITKDSIYCYLDSDTYYTPHTLNVVLDAIGVIKQLLNELRKDVIYGFAIIRPPGHHCENSGSGFCVLNNATIAAKYAQTIGFKKVFILDIDFHHGDGTQKLLVNNKNLKNIRFCSLHGYGPNVYPGTGSREENTENILNIPLFIDIYDDSTREKINDDYYLNLIQTEVNEFILRDKPDIFILSCGFDAHKNDTLQGLNLSDNAYGRIIEHLKIYNVKILVITEGGYNKYAINNSIQRMIKEVIS